MEYNKLIDHTLLKPSASENDIKNLCNEAKEYNFYSVCVNPQYVSFAKKELANSSVKVTSVIGFPLGANSSAIKLEEAKEAVLNGADELDMVVNLGLFKSGKYHKVVNDINAVCSTGAVVKVIIETSQLTKDEIIKMCEIVNNSNAKFIKTSTGFIGDGAKEEDVALMKQYINTNKQIKASGGIRDKQTFLKMINAGATRIGTSSGIKIMNELNN